MQGIKVHLPHKTNNKNKSKMSAVQQVCCVERCYADWKVERSSARVMNPIFIDHWKDDEQELTMLVEFGDDVMNIQDPLPGDPVIMSACEETNSKIMKCLIDVDAYPYVRVYLSGIDEVEPDDARGHHQVKTEKLKVVIKRIEDYVLGRDMLIKKNAKCEFEDVIRYDILTYI